MLNKVLKSSISPRLLLLVSVLSLFLLLAALAACGGNGDDDSDDSPSRAEREATREARATVEAGDRDQGSIAIPGIPKAEPGATPTGEATPTGPAGDTGSQGPEEADRAALIAFFEATGGRQWTTSTNWDGILSISQWHGVTTNDAGRVTAPGPGRKQPQRNHTPRIR